MRQIKYFAPSFKEKKRKKTKKGTPKDVRSFYRNRQNYHLDSKLSSMLDVLLSLFTCRDSLQTNLDKAWVFR